MRIIVALALLLLLPSTAAGQVPGETPERRAAYIQGANNAEITVLTRADSLNTALGGPAPVGALIRQARGFARSSLTHINTLRELLELMQLPPIVLPPVDTLPSDTLPPVVVPPVPGEEWVRTLADTFIVGDVIVPDGARWLIGPNVTIAGNLRTDGGLIGMRPGSSLAFIGADPLQYLGGGMTYSDAFARDIGLWIGGTGILDIKGTPKAGWNRECVDSSWSMGMDEIYITPTAPGDFMLRRWIPGLDSVPQFDPRVPPAECINVTRDILIEGPGHIHISSNQKQRIEYVTLRSMGVVNPVCGTVCGRYALHLHMMGDGSRGTIIRGVAAVDSRGSVFVPHNSNGVTYIDNVSINASGDGFWWDKAAVSNDILIEHMAVCGIYAARELTGTAARAAAIVLGRGERLAIHNSVACGVRGSPEYASGFEWASGSEAAWIFTGNVAHNLNGPGVKFWNNRLEHEIGDVQVYNTRHGIHNGAYNNANRFRNFLSLGGGILHNTASDFHSVDAGPGRYLRVEIHAAAGPAVTVRGQNLAARTRWEFIDCKLVPAPGFPIVQVEKTANPWIVLFRNCGVTPADFSFAADAIDGHSIWLIQDNGRCQEIFREAGRTLPPAPCRLRLPGEIVPTSN